MAILSQTVAAAPAKPTYIDTPADGEFTRWAGWGLLAIGFLGMLFAYNMGISVETTVSLYGGGDEVINTGLVADRLLAMIAAGVIALLGAVLLVVGNLQAMHHS